MKTTTRCQAVVLEHDATAERMTSRTCRRLGDATAAGFRVCTVHLGVVASGRTLLVRADDGDSYEVTASPRIPELLAKPR